MTLFADLLRCTERDITVNYVQVQYQSGGSDCGLFALAFATSIYNGVDPANVIYQQDEMREHLIKCLEEEDVTLFPQRGSRRANSKRICSIKLLVFCICRLPDDGNTMIQCMICEEWFHARCVSVLDEHIDWYCQSCGQVISK